MSNRYFEMKCSNPSVDIKKKNVMCMHQSLLGYHFKTFLLRNGFHILFYAYDFILVHPIAHVDAFLIVCVVRSLAGPYLR